MKDLRTAKGTSDLFGEDLQIRNKVLESVRRTFLQHGAEEIQTPTFELTSLLTAKYGDEASKLIFNLVEHGSDALSLRYDLTVPLARFIAQHSVEKLRRFQLGNVFRRDRPSLRQGRLREFTQCDFDVVGAYPPLLADLDTLVLLQEQFSALGLRRIKIRLNSRKFLEALFAATVQQATAPVVPSFFEFCSALDKLDKVSLAEVCAELAAKGLVPVQIAFLSAFLEKSGDPLQLVTELSADASLVEEVTHFRKLLNELAAAELTDVFVVDLKLARGLDYYTGLIFEVVFDFARGEQEKLGIERLGSLAGGGRYDGLISTLRNKPTPAVGFSLGVERILVLTKALRPSELFSKNRPHAVFVAGVGVSAETRLQLKFLLTRHGIAGDTLLQETCSLQRQMETAAKTSALAVIVGKRELETDTVKVKNLETRTEETVQKEDLVAYIKQVFASF